MGITITTIIPAITLSFINTEVNIKINSMFIKSPLNAIKKNFLKLPLLDVNTYVLFRKYETMTEATNAKIVAKTGTRMAVRYK
jgi:hypothetical protein